MKHILAIFWLLIIPPFLFAQSSEGYYRFPTIHDETVVFTSEGDLWMTDIQGGIAQRLTTHYGMESHAAISPDGMFIAFSAQYEGPTEVYTMAIEGGLPTRRTYEGENALVVGWTPDGQVLYSTEQHSTLPNRQLAMVNLKSYKTSLVPLNQASDGSYANSTTIFFTRLPFQGSRTKRYKGGTVQNIWKFTQGTEEAIPLTSNYTGTSKAPMCWNNRIYFASDRDGTMNLWSMNEEGSDLVQHTFHKGWDVQSPDLHNAKIVYQLGADLHLFEIEANKDRKLPITLASDFDQTRENWVKNPMEYLTNVHISPDGEQIVLTARGRIFVAPTKQGRFVEVTRKEGVRYRNARFILDNKSLLFLSDASGEQEFWKYPANGTGQGEQLTHDALILRFGGIPSPDGKRFAFTDKNNQLWIYEFQSKKPIRIAVSETGNFFQLSWSPDSKWLTYVSTADNSNVLIKLYSIKSKSTIELTSDRVDSYNPVWSPDGKWLYFLSDWYFQSLVRDPWGPRQPEPFLDKTTKIYMVSLVKDQRFPFLPEDEIYIEEKSEKDKEKNKEEKKKDDTSEKVAVKIDLDGLQRRIMEVPIDSGNYGGLSVNKTRLFYTETETSIKEKRKLIALDIKNDKIEPKTLVEDIRNYELSQNGNKILIRKDKDIYVFDASEGSVDKLVDYKVDLSKWIFSVNPREEWQQLFVDAWRLERDYFYDPNLHGVDWRGLLEKHLPLVKRVTDRDELNDLISQLVGELSALHIFVRGGDQREGEDQISTASLGAELKREEAAGGYRIDHIYQSEPDYLDRQSPLVKPYLNINEGDVILAINGVSTMSVVHPGILLKNQVNLQVLLKIKSKKDGKIFDAVVKPISPGEERRLRYDDWEYTRQQQVEKMSKGQIGYVHLRAMGGNNYAEWVQQFYPVYDRQGLIIDMRHNRGGNIDSWILEKLMRKAWFYWKGRVDKPIWNMQYAFRGHMVVLCIERTASDGEAFTEGFRRLGLGQVIGTRTWGGEIWLSYDNWLMDRGIASAAEYGVYGPDGEWLIEGRGVEPDIVVDNLPYVTFNGKDEQLEVAVKHLQELIQKDPRPVPSPNSHPDKSFDYQKIIDVQEK
ncbi:MAG: PD40 domain-containing protein [Calditrichaceae bacterium]|nr:PD40 domain-containing protein [Calditrichaceae bacterium]